ncbi:hypothetical protein M885DRAFT_522498 [Pelagophyceae sp. CCMP2097]|nr:hypothetical protein M885DRAFT_522498 [Pelagophyceae sp. CCMP2097]
MMRVLASLASLALAHGLAVAPQQRAVARRGVAQVVGGVVAAVVLPAFAAESVEYPEVAPSTDRLGGALEKFADVNRGFRLLKPTTWNQFEGEAGAYDFRWVDVVSAVDSITVSTSAYGGTSIDGIATVDKLGAKLSKNRDSVVIASSARVTDGILFYEYEFDGEMGHELLALCVNKNRLWQISAKSTTKNWKKKQAIYKAVVASFVPKL